jgi:hypothetical protein
MTVRTAVAIGSLLAGLSSTACLKFYEIPVEIPVQARIDVTAFQRVLVAGFLTGGSRAIDPNTETARLLKSQLRSKQDLRVIDADVLSLVDEVDKRRAASGAAPIAPARPNEVRVKDEKDLAAFEPIFSDDGFWKQVGQEYDNPLIVTGSILFTEITKNGLISRPESYSGPDGSEQYKTVKQYSDLKGYALSADFYFVDGRTGKELLPQPLKFHEESLYPTTQNTPALSTYFELMDKLLPNFLNSLSSQKIKGTRVLLK